MKPTADRTIFLDLDGVMADFDASFPAVFGLSHRSLADAEMWRHINGHASFFRDLPPCPGALEFFRDIEVLEPVILTACPKDNYELAARQKREWVREHLSTSVWVLPVLGGKHKQLFMHQPHDILIDDFARNISRWTDAGGVGVHHRDHDFNATAIALGEALRFGGRAMTELEAAVLETMPRYGHG